MNIRNAKWQKLGRMAWKPFLFFAVALLLIAGDVIAQTNYNVSLRQRRMGDTIGVEVWVKSLNASAPKLGDVSIAVTYNRSFLTPADPSDYGLNFTDSVHYDVSLGDPYTSIVSPFHATNGYNGLNAQAGDLGGTYIYQLDVTAQTNGVGFQPSTVGRGSFLGILKFKIFNHANLIDATLTGIAVNTTTTIGDFRIFDISGNDQEANTTISNTPSMTVRGITILNPNGPNEAVNRNKSYSWLGVAGYPIYFERSGLITPAVANEYGTNVLGYRIGYSLDNGATFIQPDAIRIAETRETQTTLSGLGTIDYFRSGEVVASTSDYLISRGNGGQLPVASNPGYSGMLRIIWDDDPYFPYRSEEAVLRICQLSTTGTGADIDNRTVSNICETSDFPFVLSRLFFAQLNGSSQYLKSRDLYSNATQLTVEAWINPNDQTPAVGENPGIVATGPGGLEPNEDGAWILYLKNGKFPAFRAKEIIGGNGRGYNGTAYLADLVSLDSINFTMATEPINANDAHSQNWVHIAATVQDNVVSLYVNGELKDSYTNNNSFDIRMATTQHPVWIGVNPIGGIQAGDYLHAGIKEVRIWRKALSQPQLRTYLSGLQNPTVYTNPDIKSSLELYWDFVGSSIDNATNAIQNGNNPIFLFENSAPTATASANAIRYRPDRGHVKLTSPVGGEGVSNLETADYEVRWAAYGLGDYKVGSTTDLVVEFTRNGSQWVKAIDNSAPMGNLMDQLDIEDNVGYWRPYRHATVSGQYDDLQSLMPVEENYAKAVKLRIRGAEVNNQESISDVSDYFTVAPYFALRNTGNSVVKLDEGTEMNITGNSAMIEAWINPYRFPTAEEGFFPILSKKIDGLNTHYALSLLASGQLKISVAGPDDETVYDAVSDANSSLKAPNFNILDSTWYHIAVFINLAGGTGQATATFYIDGTELAQDTVDGDLGEFITMNTRNTFPTYIGYDPVSNNSFIGELREVRFWNGMPGGVDNVDLLNFIRGAATVRSNELSTTPINNQKNLVAAFSFNGGEFVQTNFEHSGSSSSVNNLWAKITVDKGVSYAATRPFIKLVEPKFKQMVPSSTEDLYVRWTGFDWGRGPLDLFTSGDNPTNMPSDLEYSTYGGGEIEQEPYNNTASDYENITFSDALSFPGTDEFIFTGTNPPYVQFAGELNVSISDANDGVMQSPISATLTNARLRLSGRKILNSVASHEYTDIPELRTEGPLFTITPPSNFTVRALLQGYHRGALLTMPNDISDQGYNNFGFRLSLYSDNAGQPGDMVASAENVDNYGSLDPSTRGANGSEFANIPFVFTTVQNGSYWAKLEFKNYLPILTKFPATFNFDGDDQATWDIESGWDFQTWDGVADNTITESESSIPSSFSLANGYYTAYGYAESDPASTEYAATGLIYNNGFTSTTATPGTAMAALVAGDIEQDGKINAADRVRVRFEVGTSTANSDVTGDGFVNNFDRDITDNNFGKVSSIGDLPIAMIASGNDLPGSIVADEIYDPLAASSYLDPKMANLMNDAAIDYRRSGKVYTRDAKNGNQTMAEGFDYTVTAESKIVDNEFVELSFYIENHGVEFALGNCTFAVKYQPELLEYLDLINLEFSPWSNIPDRGYLGSSYSAPRPETSNPIPDIRTIEIDYDAANPKLGSLVPFEPTLMGTLKFKFKSSLPSDYEFDWHQSSGVLTIDGIDITEDGNFEEIDGVTTIRFTQVKVPNGGESWKPGRQYTVTWTKPSDDQLVNVEFSTDAGNSWIVLNSQPISVNELNLDVLAPRLNSTECLIRVVNVQTGIELDRSDNVFAILPSPAFITKPSMFDPVYAGGSTDLIMFKVEDVTKVRFEFSADGATNWKPVATTVDGITGQVSWELPKVNSKSATVAMYDAETGEFLAYSDAFKILAGGLDIITPTDGESVLNNRPQTVRWASVNVDQFDLELSLDGGLTWERIDSDLNALKTTYAWQVPNVNSDNAMLRAIWNDDTEMEYDRTAPFKIVGVVGVDETTPNSITLGEVYPNPVQDKAQFEINIPNPQPVTIELFNAAGAKMLVIANNITYRGNHTLKLDTEGLPSGTYYLTMTVGNESISNEVVVVK